MKKIRVYELARELSLSSEALVKMLREMQIPVKSHMSTVEEATVQSVKGRLTAQREAVKKDAERKQKVQAEIARKTVEPQSLAKRKDRKRRRGRKRRQVDQAAVERSVKETLATMTGGRTRRRRKEIRDEGGVTTTKVAVTEFMTLGELANLFGVEPTEVIRHCMGLGIMANINKRLDRDVIELLAGEFQVEIEFGEEYGTDIVEEIREAEKDVDLGSRPPVVTIMGHVDHGKTSLLDHIRKEHVAAGEAGGITQHIGAYEVEVPDRGTIVFLDTPGHEAFTAMRARGAEATDIVILVVAANDSVMPQTVEAIDHARAAKVPIVVAVNKIDLPDANPTRVRQDLSQHGLVPEAWGGETIFVDISAKTGEGIDSLMEMVLLVAEMRDLRAGWDRLSRGVVIEAHLDPGRGAVATVLVQDGTLRIGDAFVCGAEGGKVRALYDDRGRRVKVAPPSKPVAVLGWSAPPNAGDAFQVLEDEQQAREITLKRRQIHREQRIRRQSVVSLASLHDQIQKGEIRDLNVIVKADAQGSVEVLCDSFTKLSGDEVRVNIIHRGVGTVNESDVLLAAASRAIIFGFHVKKEPKAALTAQREHVDINIYEVIYEAVNDLKLAIEGLLKPEEIEHVRGRAEVRQLFKVPRAGVIAGSFVESGVANRAYFARVIRDGEVVHTGRVSSLKRFKDDVKEVEAGLECGIGLESYDRLQSGDVIEFFETEQILRKIS